MKLPAEFVDKMKKLLEEKEFEVFLESYDQSRYFGLRINTLKIGIEDFQEKSPFNLEPIPWTKDGFYYEEDQTPGKHPYYYAGLYYIQEPSAMLPGTVIDAQPGECVLDLCAAPGGKTVQIAAGMQGKGLLVANDISASRVKALIKNIELYGVKNAMVTNESPDKLAQNFVEYFDKIVIDAPCSGEGMFRKDREAVKSWKKYKCEKCCSMQWDILQNVDTMLKPGGTMVYSTCTFSPEEDEEMIERFLGQYQQYELLDIAKIGGVESGRPEWAHNKQEFSKTARLWPHKLKGEGHFVALLHKRGQADRLSSHTNKIHTNAPQAFQEFVQQYLNINIEGQFYTKGDNLYYLPELIPDMSGIKVTKCGWYLGSLKRDRFEPSHAMVIALEKAHIKNVIDFPADSPEIIKYLKGETLVIPGEKGYTAVCVDGYTVGWAKQTGTMLKNLYPKGWRKL